MSTITLIQDDQQITVDDLTNLATDPQISLDAVVNAAISGQSVYYGAAATKTGTTQVTVATPLYLFKAGAVYDNSHAGGIVIDLLSQLPLAGNGRIIALVLQGATVNTDTEARDFVTNALTNPPTVEARPTSTRIWRQANVAIVAGASAPTPVNPAIPNDNLPIAYVLLSSTGVVSVTQDTDYQIVDLSSAISRLISVEQWRIQAESLLDGLRSDVANLQNATKQTPTNNMLGYVLEQLARVTEASGVSQSAAFSATDFFLTTGSSDLTNVSYLAKVDEGIRFADANRSQTALQPLNSADSRFTVFTNGMLLPAYTDEVMVSVVGKDTEVSLSNVSTQNVNYVQKTISRTRIRWGNSMTVCTNSAWWASGRYDPTTNIFTTNTGETWRVQEGNPNVNHQMVRVEQFWEDSWDETYWDALVTTDSFTGTIAAQTFLMPRSAWLTKLHLGFSRLDTAGDVKILICETTASGAPDVKNVLQTVNVPHANLKLYPTLTEIDFLPTFLEAGTLYSYIMVTTGNHWIAQVKDNKYAGGTYFTSTDGVWYQGDISHDACFEIVVASFNTNRFVVDLIPWNLDGGMTDLDLLLTQIAPNPASIVFEVQINNLWYALSAPTASGNNPLYGIPASVPARMTLQGTTEIMPGIIMSQSYVRPSRPRTTFTHISTEVDTPVNITHVELDAVLEYFDPAHHTCTAAVQVGSGFSTVVTPSSSSDQVMPDGSIKRTWVFTGLTATNKFKRRIAGTTDSALSIFHVNEVTDVCFTS